MDGSVIDVLLLLSIGAVFGSGVTFLGLTFWAAHKWASEQERDRVTVETMAAAGWLTEVDEIDRYGGLKTNAQEAARPDGVLWPASAFVQSKGLDA